MTMNALSVMTEESLSAVISVPKLSIYNATFHLSPKCPRGTGPAANAKQRVRYTIAKVKMQQKGLERD